VEIPPESVWPLLVRLTGLDQVPEFQQPAPDPADLPSVSLTVMADTATLRLVDLVVGGSNDGTSVQLHVQLTAHDGPVAIDPPPPDQVEPGFGFGGGGVAPPEPMSVAPVDPPAP